MATTILPVIHTPKSGRSVGSRNELQPTPPHTGSTKSRPQTGLSAKSLKLKNANRKEQEIIFRREKLRNEQPVLSKAQTATYRNTHKHNICLDMLQAGFHRTFSEIHMLMKKQCDAREAAGPDSVLWNAPLLETEIDKLESMKFYLTEAEEALRNAELEKVYRSRFALAQYFQGRGDKWLSDHFFSRCLEVSSKDSNGQQRMCEALCFVGLATEENNDVYEAVDKFEEYYEISNGHLEWRTETGKSYHIDACDHLTRIYTKISESLDAEQRIARVEYLLKAYNMAKESAVEDSIGQAAYKLGQAYIKMNDAKTAIMYLKIYLEICETNKDDVGIGQAYESMAKAYDSDNNTEESLACLVKFVEVAEKSKQDLSLASACNNLGSIYNSKGDYAEASKYFSKAFHICQSKSHRAGTEASSVNFGVSNALSMMKGLKKHMTEPSGKITSGRLVSWKNQRQNEFKEPLN